MAQVNILNFKSLKWWIFWIHKWGHQWPKWGGNISDFADGDFHLFGSLGEAFIFYFLLAHKKNTQHVQHALKMSKISYSISRKAKGGPRGGQAQNGKK